MQQISIFELLEEQRIEDMSVLEIAQEIAGRLEEAPAEDRGKQISIFDLMGE